MGWVLLAQLGETGGGGKATSLSELRKFRTCLRLKLESGLVWAYPGSCSLLIQEVVCVFPPSLTTLSGFEDTGSVPMFHKSIITSGIHFPFFLLAYKLHMKLLCQFSNLKDMCMIRFYFLNKSVSLVTKFFFLVKQTLKN